MTTVSSWKRGDTAYVARVTISDTDGPVDLTDGYSVVWQLRRSANAGTFVDVDIDHTDAGDGVIVGSIAAEVTAEMAPGVWGSDIEVTNGDGVVLSSVTFECEVIADYSREVGS